MEQLSAEQVEARWKEFIDEADVVSMSVYDIKPSNINPRTISDSKYQSLMKDINRDPEFMWQRPVLAYRKGRNLIIYAGHQRWRACVQLGWETIPVSVDENLTDESMKNRMVLDNLYYGDWDEKMFGAFDDDVLKELNLMTAEGLTFDAYTEAKVEDAAMRKPVVEKEEDRAAEEESTEAGKHYFNLIFNTEEEKEEFTDLARNWAGIERFEDKLIKIITQIYRQ